MMREIASHLHLIAADDLEDKLSSQLLLEVLVSHHERRLSQLEAINALPLYPTEEILWDENIVPSEFYNGESMSCVYTLNSRMYCSTNVVVLSCSSLSSSSKTQPSISHSP